MMNHLIVHLCQPHLIIDYNATQYKVGYDHGEQVSSYLSQNLVHTKKEERSQGRMKLQLPLLSVYA